MTFLQAITREEPDLKVARTLWLIVSRGLIPVVAGLYPSGKLGARFAPGSAFFPIALFGEGISAHRSPEVGGGVGGPFGSVPSPDRSRVRITEPAFTDAGSPL